MILFQASMALIRNLAAKVKQYGIIYSQEEEGAPHHAALDVVILHVEAHLAADEPACLGISHSCYGGNIKVI